MSNVFVCLMGIGTVFSGLIFLILITSLVSLVCRLFKTNTPSDVAKKVSAPAVAQNTQIANKGEIIAAACAAIAEELGEDVKNIKVVSFKKA